MIKALTLDAAGTLIYPRENVGSSYCRIAAEFGALLDASALAQAFKSVFADMPPMACDASDAADLDAQERDWWRQLMAEPGDSSENGTRARLASPVVSLSLSISVVLIATYSVLVGTWA